MQNFKACIELVGEDNYNSVFRRCKVVKRLSYNTSCAAVGAIVIGALIAVWQGGEIKAAASSSLEPERVAVTYVTSINKSQPVAEAAERMQEAKEMKTIPEWPAFAYERDWTEEETYLLARLAMAEAEGCSIQCKTLIIMSVLNRVESDLFPGNIHDVIYQCTGGTYQYSCMGDGRWDRVEPNDDCYEAVEVVRTATNDYSDGCLYFEACEDDDNWHSRNLNYLYQCDAMRFYK